MQHTAVIFPMECQATIPRTEAPPEHRAASDSLAPSTPHSGYGSKIETEIYSTIWQPCSEQADLAPAVHHEENSLVICRGQRGGVCHMGVGLDEVGEGNIQTRSHPRTDRAIVQVHMCLLFSPGHLGFCTFSHISGEAREESKCFLVPPMCNLLSFALPVRSPRTTNK